MTESKKPRREYGDGSIYQRKDGRWVGSFRTKDGQRKDVYGATRAEAKKKLAEAQKLDEAGMLVPVDKQTVESYMKEWLETEKRNWEPSTYQGNVYKFQAHILPHLGNIKLQKLTTRQVQAFVNVLSDQEDLAASTVKINFAMLNASLAEAVKKKLISANPCTDVSLPKMEERDYVFLSAEQAQHLLGAVKDHKLGVLIAVALATGMRRGELLGLRWADVNLEKETLTVKHNVTYVSKKGFHDGSPKTKAGKRTIDLAQSAIETLKAHRTRQLAQRLKAPVWEDMDLVFPNAKGYYMHPTNVDQMFKRIIAKIVAVPQEMRFHDLRHTCATLLLSKSVPVHVVQKMLGHAKASTTIDIYGHAIPGMGKEAVKHLDVLFRKME